LLLSLKLLPLQYLPAASIAQLNKLTGKLFILIKKLIIEQY
jgi:hypothetical protein